MGGGGGPRERDRSEGVRETVVKINRCATVVKGGRRFSFSALVIVGDQQGKVGVGFGKANEVPSAVDKGVKDAQKAMVEVSLKGHTIPHATLGRYRASRVLMYPAAPGTGVIAGGAVRAVCQQAGIRDILTKAHGSTNPVNLTKAAFAALKGLRTRAQVAQLRGVDL